MVVALWGAAACRTPATADITQPPPLDPSPAARWTYAAYLLYLGDAQGARTYLEPLAVTSLDGISSPWQFLRDLAEARLFSGDATGAAQAAQQAMLALAQRPTTAQFRPDDRLIFARSLDALAAAADGDIDRLRQLAEDEQPAPSADAWYLLGQLEEQRGDHQAARAAYQAYLVRAPQWSYLREMDSMRLHARAFGA